MKKLKLNVVLCCLFMMAQAQPPNNPIFFGGVGDGWQGTSYTQPSTNIQLGGDGDGWHATSYAQLADNTIFYGGDGDGWHGANYVQLADNTIFYGGDGDGWHGANFAQLADASIFYGGDGDGWASVTYPVGPLPVSLLSFTGQEKDGHHILYWKTSNEENTAHFVIEHSSDAKMFRELGITNAAGNSSTEKEYTFTNKTPVTGNNFYRLKMIDIDGKYSYSNVVLLNLLKDNTTLLLYPNPSASILNVEFLNLKANANIQMHIIDFSGKTIWTSQLKYNGSLYQIDISAFASGLYQLLINSGNEKQAIKFRKM